MPLYVFLHQTSSIPHPACNIWWSLRLIPSDCMYRVPYIWCRPIYFGTVLFPSSNFLPTRLSPTITAGERAVWSARDTSRAGEYEPSAGLGALGSLPGRMRRLNSTGIREFCGDCSLSACCSIALLAVEGAFLISLRKLSKPTPENVLFYCVLSPWWVWFLANSSHFYRSPDWEVRWKLILAWKSPCLKHGREGNQHRKSSQCALAASSVAENHERTQMLTTVL